MKGFWKLWVAGLDGAIEGCLQLGRSDAPAGARRHEQPSENPRRAVSPLVSVLCRLNQHPQLPFKKPQMPSNRVRDHEALNIEVHWGGSGISFGNRFGACHTVEMEYGTIISVIGFFSGHQ